MKVVMTLLVRNEEDLLRENIRFHMSQGVDFFIVMDHLSEDATPEILRDLESTGRVEVWKQNDPGYYQGPWVSWMARRAFRHFNADWVINGDADEFWWPKTGDLKTSLERVPAGVDVLYVERSNFRAIPGGTDRPIEDMIYRDVLSRNSLGQPLPPKACHRGVDDVEVSYGNHDAHSSTFSGSVNSDLIEILHFPVRNLAQISRKVSLGGQALINSNGIEESVGATWRELERGRLEGTVESYFHEMCVDDSSLAESSATVEDTRLRDHMRNLALTD